METCWQNTGLARSTTNKFLLKLRTEMGSKSKAEYVVEFESKVSRGEKPSRINSLITTRYFGL